VGTVCLFVRAVGCEKEGVDGAIRGTLRALRSDLSDSGLVFVSLTQTHRAYMLLCHTSVCACVCARADDVRDPVQHGPGRVAAVPHRRASDRLGVCRRQHEHHDPHRHRRPQWYAHYHTHAHRPRCKGISIHTHVYTHAYTQRILVAQHITCGTDAYSERGQTPCSHAHAFLSPLCSLGRFGLCTVCAQCGPSAGARRQGLSLAVQHSQRTRTRLTYRTRAHRRTHGSMLSLSLCVCVCRCMLTRWLAPNSAR
jgi:hypothetical protein